MLRPRYSGVFGSEEDTCFWGAEIFSASTELVEVPASTSSGIPSPVCHFFVTCHCPGTTNTIDPQVNAVENLGPSELANREIGYAESPISSHLYASRFVSVRPASYPFIGKTYRAACRVNHSPETYRLGADTA